MPSISPTRYPDCSRTTTTDGEEGQVNPEKLCKYELHHFVDAGESFIAKSVAAMFGQDFSV
jgi:hypothetical protein